MPAARSAFDPSVPDGVAEVEAPDEDASALAVEAVAAAGARESTMPDARSFADRGARVSTLSRLRFVASGGAVSRAVDDAAVDDARIGAASAKAIARAAAPSRRPISGADCRVAAGAETVGVAPPERVTAGIVMAGLVIAGPVAAGAVAADAVTDGPDGRGGGPSGGAVVA